MIGFDGTTPSRETIELIKNYNVGGIILFRRNISDPSQLSDLCRKLQSLSKSTPLLIAIDHEGGRVCRLPPPFTQFPTAMDLGQCQSFSLTYSMAKVMAQELRAVGINMNLAPVLDVHTNPENPVIGDRSFGNNPMRVGSLGLAIIAGLQDHGVIACGKHFPGHGGTSQDSHKKLPTIQDSLKNLENIEFKPFQHAIANRVSTIMTAHVLYPSLDPRYPATLSKKIIDALLRKTMGFEGVVVSDDLEMGAITDHWDIGPATVKSLLAGVDLFIIGHDAQQQIEAMDAIHQAVASGKISKKRLEVSLNRLFQLKNSFLKKKEEPKGKALLDAVGCLNHKEIAERIYRKVDLKKHRPTEMKSG